MLKKYYKTLFIRAYRLMRLAHEGQTDKQGKPYYWHPVNVAKMTDTIEEAIVALLHDVLEDTWVTVEDLYKMGFPAHIINAVVGVTRQKDKETYMEFVRRSAKEFLSAKVKFLDVLNNLGRAHELPKEQRSLAKRYHRALKILLPVVMKG